MKAKRTVALLALAALWGGLIPRHVVAAAEDGHEYPSIQISGDWNIWQDSDGTVREIRPAVPLPAEPDPVAGIEGLLQFFNAAITEGSLVGTGHGSSVVGRAKALYNQLVEAQALSAAEDYAGALTVLKDVYTRCDGRPRPTDYIAGAARAEFAAMVRASIAFSEPLAFAARGDYLAGTDDIGPSLQAADNPPKGSHDGVSIIFLYRSPELGNSGVSRPAQGWLGMFSHLN